MYIYLYLYIHYIYTDVRLGGRTGGRADVRPCTCVLTTMHFCSLRELAADDEAAQQREPYREIYKFIPETCTCIFVNLEKGTP